MWMRMVVHRIVVSSVVRNQERPASHVTVVLVTGMKDVTVEKQGVA